MENLFFFSKQKCVSELFLPISIALCSHKRKLKKAKKKSAKTANRSHKPYLPLQFEISFSSFCHVIKSISLRFLNIVLNFPLIFNSTKKKKKRIQV